MSYFKSSSFFNTLLSIVVLALGISVSNAQNINLQELQNKYKGESEVVLNETSKYVIKSKKGKIDITKDLYFESIILDESGISNFNEFFYASEFTPVIKHDAYTLNSKNDKIKTDLITESSNNDGSVFFDDVREMKVTYKGLEPGARKILKTKSKFLDPNLLHKFLFKKPNSASLISFELEVDNNIEIGYKIFNGQNGQIDFKVEEKKKKKIYTWKSKDIPKYKYELSRSSLLYSAPHIVFYIKSIEHNGKKEEFLGDVDKLVKYYSGFVKDLNKEISPELVEISEGLVNNLMDEKEKVKAIFYWVKDNIKYIAYENGYEGFIPREASLVCSRKFGDCKDMSSIITAMCSSVGIDNVKLVWIGTRDLPYKYEDAPTPVADNHMIAAYDNGEEVIFLDATDQETRFGLPTGFIQGKDALIYNPDGTYKIEPVPIVPAEDNLTQYDIKAKIVDNIIIGNGTLTFHGLARSQNIARLSDTNKKRRFKTIKNRILLGNNKFNLDSYTEKNIEDRDAPFVIDFEYSLDNYLVSLDQESYINLFLKEITLINEFESNREFDFEFMHLLDYIVNVELEIPPSGSVSELPEGLHIDNKVLYFDSNFSKDDTKITLQYEVKLKDLFIRTEDFELWNKTTKKIKKFMKNTITITTKS